MEKMFLNLPETPDDDHLCKQRLFEPQFNGAEELYDIRTLMLCVRLPPGVSLSTSSPSSFLSLSLRFLKCSNTGSRPQRTEVTAADVAAGLTGNIFLSWTQSFPRLFVHNQLNM